MEKICIIILNYNSYQNTIEEVKKVHSFYGIEYKDIIVVDNCSTDNSYEIIEKELEQCVILKSSNNGGYASGNNIGLKYAYKNKYQYAWILNNDIDFVDKEYLNKILKVFREDKCIATVNGDVKLKSGYTFCRESIRPTFYDFTLGMVSYKKRASKVKDISNYGYVYRPLGCSMVLDLEKTNEVGFLDENTFLYFEENILAEKLIKYQYKCAICLSTFIIHEHSVTVKKIYNNMHIIKIMNKSFKYYLSKYRHYNIVAIEICVFFNFIKNIILSFMVR